jgi:hypothetical protein
MGFSVFELEEMSLGVQPASESRQLARRANHTVAGYHDRNRVSSVCHAHCTRCLRVAFQRKRFPFTFKILAQLAFGFEEHRMIVVFHLSPNADAPRVVILPEYRR